MKKVFIVMILILVLGRAKADRVRVDADGNWIKTGGINTYDGVTAKDRDEAYALESTIRNEGYILLNGDNREVNEADYELFTGEYAGDFFYSEYLNAEIYKPDKYKVYVYMPSFNDAIEDIKQNKYMSDAAVLELAASTVIIDYAFYDSTEKAGTVSYEFNEAIPENVECGYIQIKSPVNVEIELLCEWEQTHFIFYVQAGKPFTVKLKKGRYYIVNVNDVSFSEESLFKEDSLPYNNAIRIGRDGKGMSYDEPYIIDLTNLVNKYKITDVSLKDMPDYSLEQNQDRTEEITEVTNTDNTEETNGKMFPFVILFIFIAVFVIIYIKLKRGDTNE